MDLVISRQKDILIMCIILRLRIRKKKKNEENSRAVWLEKILSFCSVYYVILKHYRKKIDSSGIRTHATSDQYLKLAP